MAKPSNNNKSSYSSSGVLENRSQVQYNYYTYTGTEIRLCGDWRATFRGTRWTYGDKELYPLITTCWHCPCLYFWVCSSLPGYLPGQPSPHIHRQAARQNHRICGAFRKLTNFNWKGVVFPQRTISWALQFYSGKEEEEGEGDASPSVTLHLYWIICFTFSNPMSRELKFKWSVDRWSHSIPLCMIKWIN